MIFLFAQVEKLMHWLSMNEDVLLQDVDDELVLLNLVTEQYYALNETGRRFLELCRTQPSFAAVVEQIVAEYGIDAELAKRDLLAFIDAIADRRLVRLSQELR